jgi:2-isopropylmalate synthase
MPAQSRKTPAPMSTFDPASVGNVRVVPMSNQAGQSNLRMRLEDMGIAVEKGDARLGAQFWT